MTPDEIHELRESRTVYGAMQGAFLVGFGGGALIPKGWHVPFILIFLAMIAAAAWGGWRGWRRPISDEETYERKEQKGEESDP